MFATAAAPPAPIADPAAVQARMQAIYRVHADAVYRFLLRLTFGERQTAEDLTQETMLRAWRHIDVLDADGGWTRPWLFTVARRIAIDAGRSVKARPAVVTAIDPATLPAGEDEVEQLLAVQTIRQALARLTLEHRSVIVELYLRGHSVTEAAQVLGIPEGTVKSRAYYALRRMREACREATGE